MIILVRPDGGETYVHESRLDEYLERGFRLPDPPKVTKPEKKTTKVK